MFLGLDKIYNQNIKKVIVAKAERSIGGSFSRIKLSNHGFADWDTMKIIICTPGGDEKVRAFKNFISKSETILICTHATLSAFNQLDISVLTMYF